MSDGFLTCSSGQLPEYACTYTYTHTCINNTNTND